MVQEDTEAPSESATCAWMAANEAVRYINKKKVVEQVVTLSIDVNQLIITEKNIQQDFATEIYNTVEY
ncbi:hypothetical protein TNCV_2098951 [Trichonephila clavipes]|nr:hypothetical protein TNCV_2098951 [Trichonephila clavipes]